MIALLLALSLAQPAPVITTEGSVVIECSDENPLLCSSPLEQGQMAPFAGQLLTPELAIAIAQGKEKCELECKLNLETQHRMCEVALNQAKPSLLAHPAIVATLSIAATSLAVYLAGHLR